MKRKSDDKKVYIKIEGNTLTANGMRELLQDLKVIQGLDWKKEFACILATEIYATLCTEPTYVKKKNGQLEATYYNRLR